MPEDHEAVAPNTEHYEQSPYICCYEKKNSGVCGLGGRGVINVQPQPY